MTALALTGCAGAGGGQDEGDVTLTLATVSNPQMKDMEELKGTFEKENPGIKVNFVQMEEGDLRAAVTADVASKAGQYDIVTVGAYEVPQWGALGWLKDLTPGPRSRRGLRRRRSSGARPRGHLGRRQAVRGARSTVSRRS